MMKLSVMGGHQSVGEWLLEESRDKAFSIESSETDTDLLVIDVDVGDPIAIARHYSKTTQPPTILIVADRKDAESIAQAIEFTPGMGRGVFCVEADPEAFHSVFQRVYAYATDLAEYREKHISTPPFEDTDVGTHNLVNQKHLLFDMLLDSMPDCIYFKNLKSRFILFNKAMLTKFRIDSYEKLLDKTDFDMFGMTHAKEAYEDEQALILGEKQIIRKTEREDWQDGHITWVQTTKLPIKTTSGEILGTFGISRDVTNEREMEIKLQRERSLIRTLINLLPARIFVKDNKLRYIFTNREHLNYLGVETEADALGRRLKDFVQSQRAEALTEADRKIVKDGSEFVNLEEFDEEREKWMLVSKVPLKDESGHINGLVGLSVDITHQKELEANLKAKNDQMESEMVLARALQQTFLPQSYPTFPSEAKASESILRFAHYYIPSSTLGGDFLSVQDLPDGKAAILLCDVMGHGVRAALVTAMLRAITSELEAIAHEPAKFLTEMNRLLHASLTAAPQLIFVTAVYGVIDSVNLQLDYAKAGSHCMMRANAGDGYAGQLQDSDYEVGPALGMFEDLTFEQASMPLKHGDEIICYTDGVIEASGPDEAFGEDRFYEFIGDNLEMEPELRFHRLMKQLSDFCHTDVFDDDICLLSVRVK